MAQGRVDEAAKVMEGHLISGRADTEWRGAALDSRAISDGELFFALPGEQTDGHRFVSQALERGASAAIVQQSVPTLPPGGLIQVDDSLEALHRLTRHVRNRTPQKLVAVTGSIGKTTTKEILAKLLSRRYRVARNPGNLNNLFGFPVALLGIPEDTEWMVAEMGMSTPGELSRVSRLGRPEVAIFTNVQPVHLEFFGSLRAVAEAKAELLDGLTPDGLVVANRDDPEILRFIKRHRGPKVWFAMEAEANYQITDLEPLVGTVGSRFRLVAGNEEQEVLLPLHGRYNVANFLAAAACAHSLGVPLAELAEAAQRVEAPPMRGVVHHCVQDIIVVDDSYNSNPAGVAAALSAAAGLTGARHWAVLGTMLELGETSASLHREAGRQAAEAGFSPVVGVGELARELVAGAAAAGATTNWFEDAAAAAATIPDELHAGDVVLVKGSRGVGLEEVVRSLLAQVEERA